MTTVHTDRFEEHCKHVKTQAKMMLLAVIVLLSMVVYLSTHRVNVNAERTSIPVQGVNHVQHHQSYSKDDFAANQVHPHN